MGFRAGLLMLVAAAGSGAVVLGPAHSDGTEVHCDLPPEMHVKNRGGSDGAGLCVFASLKHAAQWQDVDALRDVFEWMFTRPGGGWPEKVDKVIDQICKEKGVPKPAYLQVQSRDLEILKAACQSGRMPCVTYCMSPTGRYGGQKIAHMVNLFHADDRHFVVMDNNFPRTYEWMTPAEFDRVYGCNGPGWAVILLDAGPPPPPFN